MSEFVDFKIECVGKTWAEKVNDYSPFVKMGLVRDIQRFQGHDGCSELQTPQLILPILQHVLPPEN